VAERGGYETATQTASAQAAPRRRSWRSPSPDVAPGADWDTFNAQRASFYKDRSVLDDARFLTLFPTDRLDLNTQPRQTAGYPAFQRAFLQGLATSLGISYEQLSMDWSSTNYSSARAALNEVWRGVQRLRAILVWGFALPIFAAVLEDALDNDLIEIPKGCADFYEQPAAWLRAQWIGPGRGFIDPVKEAPELRRPVPPVAGAPELSEHLVRELIDDSFDMNDLGYMERNALKQVEWETNLRVASNGSRVSGAPSKRRKGSGWFAQSSCPGPGAKRKK
jgi:hypothetical protein